MTVTPQAIRLQEALFQEVMAQVLGETLQSPLPAVRMVEIRPLLDEFTQPPFEIFNMQTSPASLREGMIESSSEKIISLWKSEGQAVTREQALWQLRYRMQIFLSPASSPEENVLVKQQLTDLAPQVEAHFLRLLPLFPSQKLTALSNEFKGRLLAKVGNPRELRLRPVAPNQWPQLLEKGDAVAAQLLAEETRRHNAQDLGFTGEQVYYMLWQSVVAEMTVPLNPDPMASYPRDLGKRTLSYHRKLHDPQEEIRQMRLRQFVLSDDTLDREVMVWLLRVGLEQPVRARMATRATLTLPLPTPHTDGYYWGRTQTLGKGQPHQAVVQLRYENAAPGKLRLKIDSRKAQGQDFDFFMYRVGMTVWLDGPRLTIAVPTYRSRLTQNINQRYDREDVEALRLRGAGTGVPLIDPYVKDALTLQRADWSHAKVAGKRTINGVLCQVRELLYPRPLKVAEPHFITGSRRFISASKGVTVREEDFDAEGKTISVTIYDQFHAVSGGSSVALHSRTIVLPGKAMFWMKDSLQSSNASAKIRGAVRFDGRSIGRDYRLWNGKVPVVSRLVVSNDRGQRLLSLAVAE